MRNGDFISKYFGSYTTYLPLNFILKFLKGRSYIKISNPTSKVLNLKANTALGSVSFDLIRNLSNSNNHVTHFHTDVEGSFAMCSKTVSDCPIHQTMTGGHDTAHTCHYHILHNHGTQSHDQHATSNMTCTRNVHTNNNNNIDGIENDSTEYKLNEMMKEYYKHNQDSITRDQIRELKIKTFPYLSNDDVCLSMSDRNIVRKELGRNTDTVLSDIDKHSIRDFYYSMRECLSKHDNPSIQNK